MKQNQIVWWVYGFTIIALFLYSYTQVDLSLTLSKISVWQTIEKAFQYIGYFQRPISTIIYILLLVLLFGSQIWIFRLALQNKISRRAVWLAILLSAGLLTFSYNAFSYDLFNYIFDAKIVTYYHMNPYIHKALDFPQDPMLSFMHWTQRTYPYGPIWLVLTIPLSFVGLQFFLPTFFLFKALMGVSYLGTCYFLEKSVQRINAKQSLSSLIFFAFSPLVIVEGLVSAHNDIAMIALATISLWLLLNNKNTRSIIVLLLSVGVKFATALLLPVWVIFFIKKTKQKVSQRILVVGLVLSILPIILASIRTNFQPWYVFYLFPFAALLDKKYQLLLPYSIFSLFALLQYVPFLYTGNWNSPIPLILTIDLVIGVCLAGAALLYTIAINIFVAKPQASQLQ